MDYDLLEKAIQKIAELEKKIDLYFEMLKIENELSFILNGNYVLEEDLQNIVYGTY